MDHENNAHTAIVFHSAGETCNVKVHNIISDYDLLSNSDKYNQLIDAINYLKLNSGVLVFINQPSHHKVAMKEYGIGAQILKSLGIKHMCLLTNAKKTDFVGLSGFGLEVAEVINPSL